MRLLCVLVGAFCSFFVSATTWEREKTPTINSTSSIGSYANGCLDGAQALPITGVGYQIIRPQRGRYYGHTESIQFIERLGVTTSDELNTNLLIGDISLPRGGRFSSGHSSHQTGLDIDIWLRLTSKRLSENELAVPKPVSVVDLTNYKLRQSNWTEDHFQVIRYAAKDEKVVRIFVHPVIKQTLCEQENADINDRAWLGKIRPWWGHHSHFHVRLKCPEGSSNCVNQASPPEGDGCGDELASWAPKTIPVPPPKKVAKSKKKKKVKVMPSQCLALISNK
ncbi:penicillin-insensitive murein endopeptidase [Vibrio sp. 10N.261.46.E12]|uniref:penicillin-insensitive murein endopeptidase n=1 Tax=unclassified Vibrio TaxID=2614977 RepID=UPI0009753CE3|nr:MULTISPECIES: penicillin-insensitive murein endopeptidase [unclassified Vibrio]OMO33861.1 penicillin-insensitive murein endopeptidase [Vibrio sp. 10N.261.45.E1]PMJ21206.1 penicillin-insensitive murein endopeptidase [Vibrio sp. 10N.286.45.B6]PML92925.1 penicillin-insensitive murein endopeptidase [Vibrio sp. 10N.261.49.E11]PMM73035.1 penicillin-insensitive murein endopeptidase [Vibrio sp. 10N.261.46.F12]PMM80890.1 penicillin-insensitive murein endopeptidase [Vibrio sp. 10N.261.46.E8]